MNDMTPDRNERKANLKGLGTSRKRVEDARFTQGKGNYVDDIKLDGMLHGDFVRSPYAHARIKSINTDAAMALDGVGRSGWVFMGVQREGGVQWMGVSLYSGGTKV